FAAPGKAAKNSPSITSTSPIATMNWAMLRRRARDDQPLFRRDRWSGAAAGGRRGVAHLARGIGEKPEEVRIGFEQHTRIVGAQAGFVSLHRAIEREELGIPPIGFGKNAVALGIALAANLLAFRLCFSEQYRDVAICSRADLLGALGALRAELLCLALTLGLHALIDCLAVLLRQVGAADAHVDHVDPVGLRLVVELLTHAGHELLAPVAHDLH